MSQEIACTVAAFAALTLTAASCQKPAGDESSPSIPAPTAQAGTNCPNTFVPPSENPDCHFLYMMARDHFSAASPADLISQAHTACGLMEGDGGTDPVMDVAIQTHRNNPAITVAQAGLFDNLAAAAYCQSVIRH